MSFLDELDNNDQIASVGGNPLNKLIAIENTKSTLLSRPDLVDNLVAQGVKRFSPVVATPKYAKHPDKVSAVDDVVPEDHPMRGYAPAVRDKVMESLGDPRLKGASAKDILDTALKGEIMQPAAPGKLSRLEETYKYKRKADSNLFQWGEDKKTKKLPGYDEWLGEKQLDEEAARSKEGWFAGSGDIAQAAAEGAAWGTVLGGITGSLAGGAGALPGAAAGAVSTAVTFGALEVPAHPLKRLLHGTEWYSARADSDSLLDKAKVIGADLLPYITADLGLRKAVPRAIASMQKYDIIKDQMLGKPVASTWPKKGPGEGGMPMVSRMSGYDIIELSKSWKEGKAAEAYLDDVAGKIGRSAVFDEVDALQGFKDTISPKTIVMPGSRVVSSGFAMPYNRSGATLLNVGNEAKSYEAESFITGAKKAPAARTYLTEYEKQQLSKQGWSAEEISNMKSTEGAELIRTGGRPDYKKRFMSITDDAAAEHALQEADKGVPLEDAVQSAAKADETIQAAKRVSGIFEYDSKNGLGVAGKVAEDETARLDRVMAERQQMWEKDARHQEILKSLKDQQSEGEKLVPLLKSEPGISGFDKMGKAVDKVAVEGKKAVEDLKGIAPEGTGGIEAKGIKSELEGFYDGLNAKTLLGIGLPVAVGLVTLDSIFNPSKAEAGVVVEAVKAVGKAAVKGLEKVAGKEGEMTVKELVEGGTKAVDETGKPIALYHGTGTTYEKPLAEKFDPNGLYGPGHYMTDAPDVASTPGYAKQVEVIDPFDYEFAKKSLAYHKEVHDNLLAVIRDKSGTQKLSPLAADFVKSKRIFGQLDKDIVKAEDWANMIIEQNKGTIQTFEANLNSGKGAQVRKQFADIKNPLDMDKKVEGSLLDAAYDEVGIGTRAYHELQSNFKYAPSTVKADNDTIYRIMTDYFGSKDKTNKWLQEQGYDGITHTGGVLTGGKEHKVWIAFKPEQVKTGWSTDPSSILYGIGALAAAGTGLLASLVTPDSAEASVGSEIAAGAVKIVESLKPVAERLSKTMTTEEVAKKFVDAGWVKTAIDPMNPTQMPKAMTAPSLSNKAVETFGNITGSVRRTKGLPVWADRFMSMYHRGKIFFDEGFNPSVELGARWTAIVENISTRSEVVKTILDRAGVETAASKVEAVMKPFNDRFASSVVPLTAVDKKLSDVTATYESLFDKIKRRPQLGGIKMKGEDFTYRDKLGMIEGEMANLQKAREVLLPEVDALRVDHMVALEQLAAEEKGVRLFLAQEDTASFTKYPFLKNMITDFKEKTAVAEMQMAANDYALRIKAAGMKPKTDEPWAHHAFHPAYREELAMKRLGELNIDASNGIPFAKLNHRSTYSIPLMPDAEYAWAKYIPDMEKRIEMHQFWYGAKGKNNWKNFAFSQDGLVQASPAMKSYFDSIVEATKPASLSTLDQWANRYTLFETLRLIAGAPSVGFKHVFKQIGTGATLGIGETVGGIPDATMGGLRVWARKSADGGILEKMGIKGPGIKNMYTDQMLGTFTNTNQMRGILNDLGINGQLLKGEYTSYIDKALRTLNDKGQIFVAAVEGMDRANSVLAAIKMAQKAGMTYQQAHYGIMDTILKNNFMSGVMNPVWARDPKVRAMFLFMSTPFKIWERRLMNAAATGRVIKMAGQNIKGRSVTDVLSSMKELKLLIREGEDAFKGGIIADAINSEKDFFGTPIAKQFMKELVISGMVLSAGGMMGMDLMPQIGHTPLVRTDRAEPVVQTAPIINGVFKTMADRRAASKQGEDPDFFVTNFLQNWLGKNHIIPQTIYKGMKMTEGDIPEIYKGSPLQYLFSVPSK